MRQKEVKKKRYNGRPGNPERVHEGWGSDALV